MAMIHLSALNTKGSGLNITQIVKWWLMLKNTTSELIVKITEKNTSISAIGEIKVQCQTFPTVKTLRSTAYNPSNSSSLSINITD